MNTSYLRPAALLPLALALGLSACGGKATFPINVTIDSTGSDGLVYAPLILTEANSGQTLRIETPGTKTASFANTLEYGTAYDVKVTATGTPPHQTCQVFGGNDTAGRRASIDVTVICNVNRYGITGSVTVPAGNTGNFTGLQLVNGSQNPVPQDVTPATAPAVASYGFPSLKYDTAFSLAIFRQPTDGVTKCTLVPKTVPTGTTVGATTAAGRIGDANVLIDVVCAKP